jgi:NADH-quinone oxidoreductase subunit G
VVLAGRRLAEHPLATDVALEAAMKAGARFGLVDRRANDRGALRAGVHPGLLPGGRRVSVVAEREEVEALWGPITVADEGRSTIEILRACAERQIDVLYLIGVDPLGDVPDAALARQALQNVPTLIVQSLELADLEPAADVFPRPDLPRARPRDRLGGQEPVVCAMRQAEDRRADSDSFRRPWHGRRLGSTRWRVARRDGALWAAWEPADRPTAWAGAGAAVARGPHATYQLLVDEGRLSEGATD